MTYEVIRFVIVTDFVAVDNIFSDKKISETFENEYGNLTDLVQILIEDHRNQLLSNPKNRNLKSFIPTDDKMILSKLEPILKAQLLATALNECVNNKCFNIKSEILKMMEPAYMMQIIQRAIEETFKIIINNAYFEEKDTHNIELMS